MLFMERNCELIFVSNRQDSGCAFLFEAEITVCHAPCVCAVEIRGSCLIKHSENSVLLPSELNEFYLRVTVHLNEFLFNKTK